MKNLISYKTGRLLTIAEMFVLNDDLFTLDDFMRANSCSNVTAANDLNELMMEWNDTLNIQSRGSAYFTRTTSLSDLMEIKHVLLHREIKVRLLLNIFFNPHFTIIDHSLTLDYSESHLRKQIVELDTFLNEYDCHIEYNKDVKSYKISSETPIRLCLVIADIIHISSYKELIPDEAWDIGKQRGKEICGNFKRLNWMDDYMSHFFACIAVYEQVTKSPVKTDYFLSVDARVQDKREDIKEIIMKYFMELNIKLSKNDLNTVVDIFTHYGLRGEYIGGKVNNVLNRYDCFFEKLNKINKIWVDYVMNLISELETVVGINFSTFYSEIFFQLYSQYYHLFDSKRLLIGVYSDMGERHASSHQTFLETHFSNHEFELLDINKTYDLIISTCSKLPNNLHEKIPVCSVADYLTQCDIYNVFKSISSNSRFLNVDKMDN